jgi:Ca2+-binding RTX toxin-like protein
MAPRHDNKFRPELENLESRRLLAASVALNGGVLSITGTDGPDTVFVTQAHGKINVIVAGPGGSVQTFNKANVKTIFFDGRAGDDIFVNLTNVRAIALGGDGNDILVGGRNNDILIGGAGNDILIGGRGNDFLEGDAGDDVLMGGPGNDMEFGEDGNDRFFDDHGRDEFHPGPGENEIHDRFDDRVFPEAGEDHVFDDHGMDNPLDDHGGSSGRG